MNYAYKSKYLAEFVWRYQGSYIFDRSNKFGFFPGISLGYVISEEDFFQKEIALLLVLPKYGHHGDRQEMI